MRKYAWLLTLVLTAALALVLAACAGEAVPSTPRSTITPTSVPPIVSPTTSTPPPLINGVPAIPHPTAGYENCLVCHETGIAGSVAVPADHAGRTNDTCTACHEEAATVTPPATTTTTATPTATATATPTATPTQTAGAPPVIPHDLAGRDDCLACHQTGVAGAPEVPADHAGRTNDTCTMCHQPGATGTPTATATATATPTTTPTATPTQTSGGIPQVPHFTDGYTQCLVCHAEGIGGAPAVPADHAGRADSTCTACHTPAATQVALQYPAIPHDLAGRDNCLACHQTGIAGAPVVPADHAGRTNDTCTVCHKAGGD